MKYLELANPTNPNVLRIKERIIGSNPRLFGSIYKLHVAPYPTIEVKVLMPLRGSMQPMVREEKKVQKYNAALSPVQPPKTSEQHISKSMAGPPPVTGPGMFGAGTFVPAARPAERPPPKIEPFTAPPIIPQPRTVPPPIIRPPVFNPIAQPVRSPYESPPRLTPYQPPVMSLPQPTPIQPAVIPPPVVSSAGFQPRPIQPPQFRAPPFRPFPRPAEDVKATPFPNAPYEAPGLAYAPPPVTPPLHTFAPPPIRAAAPPPVTPPAVNPRMPAPPKRGILEQANFGIAPTRGEVH